MRVKKQMKVNNNKKKKRKKSKKNEKSHANKMNDDSPFAQFFN